MVFCFCRSMCDEYRGKVWRIHLLRREKEPEGLGDVRMKWGTEHSWVLSGRGGNRWTLLFVLVVRSAERSVRYENRLFIFGICFGDLFWGLFGHSSPLSPDFLSIVGLFSLNTTSSDSHINSIKTCLTNSWPLLR